MKWKYNTGKFLKHIKSSAGGKLQHKLVLIKNINFASLSLVPQESKTRKGKYAQSEKEGDNKEQKEMKMT